MVKNLLLTISVILFLTSLTTLKVSAQLAGSSAFMQGLYVEIGISECGVYGTMETPPLGPHGVYHGVAPIGLGFIVDHEKDGWEVATAAGQPVFCGDYFAPGSPEEGWAVQYGDNVYANHYIPCSGYSTIGSSPDIPGGIISYSDTLGVKQVIWEGDLVTADISLHFQQITTLPDTALFFTTQMLITNTGISDITDLYFQTNIDPDQDVDHCGTYVTHNSILSNPPLSDTAKVIAIGDECGCYFSMTAVDTNARASYGNFMVSDGTPFEAWHGDETANYYTTGVDWVCDCAVQLGVKMNIAASATASYSYARSFLPEADIQALNFITGFGTPVDTTTTDTTDNTDLITDITDQYFSVYPNPASTGFNLDMTHIPVGGIYMEIRNTNGQLVSEKVIENINHQYITTDNLSSGLYIIKIVTSNKTFSKSLSIQ